MRPNRYVILVSILLGSFGLWFSADAVGQYLDTVRSFAGIEYSYVEDSFEWRDPEHRRGTAEFRIHNDADNAVTIAHLEARLYFDGEFAGARYTDWDAVEIPAGETTVVEVPFLTSIERMRPAGSEAELSVESELRLDFEGIEREMTVRASDSIGTVPYVED